MRLALLRRERIHNTLLYSDNLSNVALYNNLRGAIKKKKNGKIWSFGPNRGGGLTESQLFVKFFQNQICLGTVHKCDETHTTQMGRQYLINS